MVPKKSSPPHTHTHILTHYDVQLSDERQEGIEMNVEAVGPLHVNVNINRERYLPQKIEFLKIAIIYLICQFVDFFGVFGFEFGSQTQTLEPNFGSRFRPKPKTQFSLWLIVWKSRFKCSIMLH